MKSNQFDQPNAVMAEGAANINIEFGFLLVFWCGVFAQQYLTHVWNATSKNRRSANVVASLKNFTAFNRT